MKINKLNPHGFCGGVKRALSLLDEAIISNIKPIYLLGDIIHNRIIVEKYKSKGIIILNDKSKTRLELLDSINDGTVVFSAHGVSPSVYQKAINKGLNIIDTTCPNVQVIHNQIIKHLNEGYEIIYIGNKQHPECEGVMGISSSIKLISNINDIDFLNITSDKIYVTNQTTLSLYDIEHIYNKIKKLYPTSLIDNKICMATTLRQKAVIEQEKVDLGIIVGDSNSSNTNKLVETTKKSNIKPILVENLEHLKSLNLDYSNIRSVSITSGASTPENLVNKIIEYLENK